MFIKSSASVIAFTQSVMFLYHSITPTWCWKSINKSQMQSGKKWKGDICHHQGNKQIVLCQRRLNTHLFQSITTISSVKQWIPVNMYMYLFVVTWMDLKQEDHGPHRSPEKPVQINKYIWTKLWLFILQNWPSSSGGGDFLNFVNVPLQFC